MSEIAAYDEVNLMAGGACALRRADRCASVSRALQLTDVRLVHLMLRGRIARSGHTGSRLSATSRTSKA